MTYANEMRRASVWERAHSQWESSAHALAQHFGRCEDDYILNAPLLSYAMLPMFSQPLTCKVRLPAMTKNHVGDW